MALEIRTLDRLGAVVVALVLGLCVLYVLASGVRIHARLASQEAQLRQKRQSHAEARAALHKVQAALTSADQGFAQLRDKIPESGHIGEFLERLDGLMKERQIALTRLEPQPAVRENIFLRTPVRFACSGASADLFRLVFDLETMDRVVTLESMQIRRASLKEPCEAEIQASLYERALTDDALPRGG
jgi:Tfp pilus assembly protein PilO